MPDAGCDYRLGPCVDGTLTGRRCGQRVEAGGRCGRHLLSGVADDALLRKIRGSLVSSDLPFPNVGVSTCRAEAKRRNLL